MWAESWSLPPHRTLSAPHPHDAPNERRVPTVGLFCAFAGRLSTENPENHPEHSPETRPCQMRPVGGHWRIGRMPRSRSLQTRRGDNLEDDVWIRRAQADSARS